MVDKRFLIDLNIDVRQAMKKLDDSHRKVLFVMKDNSELAGVLTDGDIRRWILGGHDLGESVDKVCNKDFISVSKDYDLVEVKKIMLEYRIQALPIIGKNGNLLELLFWDTIFGDEDNVEEKESIAIPVVIMAGGEGTRLDPFTRILPKPLIPIGYRSILEVIIDKFREYSVEKFFISVHHKAKLIKAYFDELSPSYEIQYLDENKPLGTIGALSQLKNKVDSSIILTNCDTIILCDYSDMLKFHNEKNYDITLVGSMINHKVPYGLCEIEENGKLVNLIEKPEYSYLVSTGMYLIRKTALSLIPENTFFNITDLMEKVRDKNGSVGVYPISEKSWLDTGEWKEYNKTVERLSS